jgi:hypothetical protein
MQACVESQRKKLTRDYYVAKVDTIFSPKPGVIPKGHYQPGTDPISRTSQTEQRLAMLDHPWGSQRSYLKIRLARLYHGEFERLWFSFAEKQQRV